MHFFPAIVALTLGIQMVYCLDKEHKDYILKVHNKYRADEPGACQMERMEYDESLEKFAQAWADNCVFEHEYKGRGENLAWNSRNEEEKSLMDTAAKDWYAEIKDYRRGQKSCSMSCHYTQMVWSTTNKVGCATKRCSTLQKAMGTKGYDNAWYLVCFYLPAGNMYGTDPYKTQCDVPCLEGQTKGADGLCGTGSGASEAGNEGGDEGGDEGGNEGGNEGGDEGGDEGGNEGGNEGGDEGGDEGGNEGGDEGGNEGGDEGGDEGGNEGGNEGGSAGCVDEDENCSHWADKDECYLNPAWMMVHCAKSCDTCNCEDSDEDCQAWADRGECVKNPGYLLKHCRSACGHCG